MAMMRASTAHSPTLLGPRACALRSPPALLLPAAARLRPRGRPVRLLTGRCAASSTTTAPDMPAASAAVAPGSCLISLTFQGGGSVADAATPLQVDRALLWHASPVLRDLMASGSCIPVTPAPKQQQQQQQPPPGIGAGGAISGRAPQPLLRTSPDTKTSPASSGGSSLSLLLTLDGDDRREDWEVVVQILQHKAALPVTWDNVSALLRLATKYDMAAVRKECAGFLAVNASKMSLDERLDSPKNLLHAASLAEKYLMSSGGSGSSSGSSSSAAAQQPDLQPYVTAINAALQAALRPLYCSTLGDKITDMRHVAAWQPAARHLVVRLKALLTQQNTIHTDVVTPGVQAQAMVAMLDGLDALAAVKSP